MVKRGIEVRVNCFNYFLFKLKSKRKMERKKKENYEI